MGGCGEIRGRSSPLYAQTLHCAGPLYKPRQGHFRTYTASESPEGTIHPLTLSRTCNGMPPASLQMIGTPFAMHSVTLTSKPSLVLS